jgi:hypothetical protein
MAPQQTWRSGERGRTHAALSALSTIIVEDGRS